MVSVRYRRGHLSLGDGEARTEECVRGSSEKEDSVTIFWVVFHCTLGLILNMPLANDIQDSALELWFDVSPTGTVHAIGYLRNPFVQNVLPSL